jgi:translation initiation factor IF-3
MMAAFQPRGVRLPERKERVNERIRAREIRVIGADGAQLGIMIPQQALDLAREAGLDLVEVAATSVPPVCRIMDYGRFLYEQRKKEHAAKRKQKQITVKEVKFRPRTDEHDYVFKKNHIIRFLNDGDKVKATVIFRGRENAHLDIGLKILDRIRGELQDICMVETPPRKEGSILHMILAPRKGAASAAARPAETPKARG